MCAMSCIPATAQDQQAAPKKNDKSQRVCTDDDLIDHMFRMVVFKEMPARRETNWVHAVPYHYLSFSEDNNFMAVATNIKFKTLDKLKNMMKPKKGAVYKYRLDSSGVLDLTLNDKILYHYSCIAILKKKTEGFEQGDIVLRGYTRKAKTQLYKVYRRLD